MPELAVCARDVTRNYGERKALDALSLDVPIGSVFGLLGPNGSGKSTFIAMLAAMEQPAAGELEVFGQAAGPGLRVRVGTVFQENTADPLMRVGEYLRFAGQLFGVGRRDIETRMSALLATFGLADRARDAVSTLSGGMRRRLEVARALVHEPDLLLLDEPTTGIDAGERTNLWETLLAARAGTTILLATNDLAEADAVCEQVAFLRAGRVVLAGAPAGLKAGLRRESVRVELVEPSEDVVARLAAVAGAHEITIDDTVAVITTDNASILVPRLFEATPGAIRAVTIARASLEDAYFQHVGRRVPGAAK